MRVLHVLPSLDQNYGGPLRAVLDLSTRARRFGLESEIVGVGEFRVPDNPFPRELVHSVPLGLPFNYRYSPALERWLNANLARFDGVVLHGMWLHVGRVVARTCTRMGKKFACFPHGMLEPWSIYGNGPWKAAKKIAYWTLWESGIFQQACAVFYTTERERRLANNTFLIANDSHIVMPYGIDLRPKSPAEPQNPELLQPPSARMTLFLGRIHPKKNVPFLLEAWAKARPRDEWRLVIAGPARPRYVAKLRSLIRRYGLEKQVSLVGAVAGFDKSYLFSRADWFVLPSSQENFGVAVLEAVGFGCPVAISNQVYVADYFHPCAEVMPLRMEDWTAFFRERMPDDAHRAELIELDRKQILPQFDIEKVAHAWAEEMKQVFRA